MFVRSKTVHSIKNYEEEKSAWPHDRGSLTFLSFVIYGMRLYTVFNFILAVFRLSFIINHKYGNKIKSVLSFEIK